MGCLAAQAGAVWWAAVSNTVIALLCVPIVCYRWIKYHLLGFAPPADFSGATFWEGLVTHVRLRPARNEFSYGVRVAVVDLERPPKWFAPQARDHLDAQGARAFAMTAGRVLLLTNPISAGYIQNPISVYYCYEGDVLRVCIAEVTNTPWGARVRFLFDPQGASVPKALHVSPLMDMDNTWLLKASDPLSPPEGRLTLSVKVTHPELGCYFDALLVAQPSELRYHPNECGDLRILWRYAFLPHRIAFWIYSQALVLLIKGVPFFNPPSDSYKAKKEKSAAYGKMISLTNGQYFDWTDAMVWPWRD